MAGWIAALALAAGLHADPTSHRAFTPPVRPPAPDRATAGDPWCATAVDAFILHRLRQSGAEPSPEADRPTLIRRLSFDLRGLPPSPDEVDAFVADPRPDAFRHLVDRFLASTAYGERWGRHWLDIAGYADSNGYFNADSDRPLAWRYRDWVVRSLNEDLPVDRFITDQVAGDERVGFTPGGDVPPEHIDALTAVHFLRNPPDGTGESDGNPLELKVDRYSVLEGNVQLIGHAFLGLTLQCARCHDHKFEPVTQAEYYGIEAILRPAFDPDHWLKPGERVVEVGTRAEREEHHRRTREADADLAALRAALESVAEPFRKRRTAELLAALDTPERDALQAALDAAPDDRTAEMKARIEAHPAIAAPTDADLDTRFPELAAARETLRAGIRRVQAMRPPALPRIATLFEPAAPPPEHHLLVRGSHAHEGDVAVPAVPAVLDRKRPPAQRFNPDPDPADTRRATTGRRLALARWLTAPDHPLVARVLVNRVWALHFGRGLVPSIDNLGLSGAAPSHPDLLDWLATEFVRSGWSLKHLHRILLNSATWRQATRTGTDGMDGEDPAPLFSGHPLRRLDAEAVRDALLAVSGELDPRIGGPYVPVRPTDEGQFVVDETRPGARRRSLYLRQRRTEPVTWLQVFDGPEPNPVCIQRQAATVPLQSLALLNSDFIRRRSRALAERVLAEGTGIDGAFRRAWSRTPTDAERVAAEGFLAAQTARYGTAGDAEARAWTDLCQMILAANAFLYVD